MLAGCPQPKTASLADQGVRRSICARIMPSRKSAACLGKSIDRNRTWSDLRRRSTRLPRSADSQSAGRDGSGRPFDTRNETSGKAVPFFTNAVLAVNVLPSPSMSNTCRWGTKRLAIKLIARATAAIHSPNSSLSSEIIVITRQLLRSAGRSRKGSCSPPSLITTSDEVWRPLSNLTVVRMRKKSLFSIVAPAWAGPSAVAIAAVSVGSAGRSLRNSFRPEGVIPGNAAITSGGATRGLIFGCPLKTVTNGKARSTSAGGSPSTSASSFACANGACRGE